MLLFGTICLDRRSSYKAAKYLVAILNPLTGMNGFTIKNGEYFVNKIRDLEIPLPRKMVSYDVSALCTNIPVDEAIWIIRRKLEKDTSLSERCDLTIDQIITLLEFSLNTTYFVCDGVFYLQIRGAPIGSPISPRVANLAMEHFEEKALDTALTKPHVWYCTLFSFQNSKIYFYCVKAKTILVFTLYVNKNWTFSKFAYIFKVSQKR